MKNIAHPWPSLSLMHPVMWHTQVESNGGLIITGCDTEGIVKEGTRFSQAGRKDYIVVREVLERRDHKGVFTPQEKSKDAFFKAFISWETDEERDERIKNELALQESEKE